MKKIVQIIIIGTVGFIATRKVKELRAEQNAWKESTDSIKTQ